MINEIGACSVQLVQSLTKVNPCEKEAHFSIFIAEIIYFKVTLSAKCKLIALYLQLNENILHFKFILNAIRVYFTHCASVEILLLNLLTNIDGKPKYECQYT